MSILYGFYQADSGAIAVQEKSTVIRSAHDAIAAGIGMVQTIKYTHQSRFPSTIFTNDSVNSSGFNLERNVFVSADVAKIFINIS
jgi:ABC-type uncharacterized transport system ATPase subunit